jgi:MFS family permease
MLEAFKPEDRGKAMAFFGVGIVVAPVLGPVLGGWLTDNYSWRWVFYVNLPIGIAAFMMLRRYVFDPPYLSRERTGIDYWGIGLLAIGIAALSLYMIGVLIPENDFSQWIEKNVNRTLQVTGPSRWEVMRESLTLISASPILGYGMDQGTLRLPSSKWLTSDGVHNTILQTWLGGGILAFCGVILVYGIALRRAFQTMVMQARGTGKLHTMGLAASVFGWFLIDMTQPSIYLRYTWITVALLIGLLLVSDEQPGKVD